MYISCKDKRFGLGSQKNEAIAFWSKLPFGVSAEPSFLLSLVDVALECRSSRMRIL